MNKGQRVEIIDGVLKGEKATVVGNPEDGEHEDDGEVFLHFDNHEKVYGREKGYAILSEQWCDIESLITID